jgi:hypothetical protein
MEKYKNIILFSPIRTGSTLIYNILLEILNSNKKYENVNLLKSHNFDYDKNNLYIITIRHPYNSVISGILKYGNEINKKITDENIKKGIDEYLMNGGLDILQSDIKHKNIVLIKYEFFYNNYEYIYDILTKKINIVISNELKKIIEEKTNIENVILYTKKYNSFNEYCKITHWHGNHISKNKGKTDFNTFLTNKQKNILLKNPDLTKIIEKYY